MLVKVIEQTQNNDMCQLSQPESCTQHIDAYQVILNSNNALKSY